MRPFLWTFLIIVHQLGENFEISASYNVQLIFRIRSVSREATTVVSVVKSV